MNFYIFPNLLCSLILISLFGTSNLTAKDTVVTINPSKVIAESDRSKLIGTNMALWDYPPRYYLPSTEKLLQEWHPGLVRIPGGSWSDEYFWNGNGVMKWFKLKLPGGYQFHQQVDKSKFKNGKWMVDYSKYAPGFRINKDNTVHDFHGNFDIKRMHDYIKNVIQTDALVTVNAGTGTPKMAEEWVKWANKTQKYNVHYWEIGNELEGSWEAGHFLPDGSEMTGKIYAERFAKFAKAMKTVDPSIKVGGAAGGEPDRGFTDEMLQYSGKYVDFVSFHFYPEKQSSTTDEKLFGHIYKLKGIIKKIRDKIKKYQPERADKIEIGITEWNCKLPEDRQTADMTTGLWTSLFIGEMMKTGVNFANQWDLFTQKKKGGHCALHFTGDRIIPKSQYWAFWLWNNCMDDTIVNSKVSGNKNLRVIATKNKNNISIMLVNTSRKSSASTKINVNAFNYANKVESFLFSHRSYLWNYIKNQPEWSIQPVREILNFSNNSTTVTIPPFSIRVLRLFPKNIKIADKSPAEEIYPDIQYIVPEKIPVNRKVEAWALYRRMGNGAPVRCTGRLKLKVTRGKATITPDTLDLRDAAAPFYIKASEPGHLTIEGFLDGVPVDYPPDDPPIYIKVIPIMEMNKVLWDFEKKNPYGKLTSTWKIQKDKSVKRQNTVAAIKMDGVQTKRNKDIALEINNLPHEFPREDLGGVFAEIILSPDFKADKDAHLVLVLQSKDNYWMQLKSIPISKLSKNSDNPTKLLGKLPSKLRYALGGLFSIKFIISSNHPITGTIYFDNIGVILERQ
jgi:alpha-L-arabinofuranosidase